MSLIEKSHLLCNFKSLVPKIDNCLAVCHDIDVSSEITFWFDIQYIFIET